MIVVLSRWKMLLSASVLFASVSAAQRRILGPSPLPLQGQILDSADRPIADAFVGIRLGDWTDPLSPDFGGIGVLTTRSAADGRFQVTEYRRDSLFFRRTTRRELLVLVPGYHPVFLAVPDSERTIVVHLRSQPWTPLQWTIHDPLGQPIPGAQVELIFDPVWHPDSVVRLVRTPATTDARGHLALPVPPGQDLVARLTAPGFRPTIVVITTATVTTPATTFTLWRPIIGQVTDADGRPLPHAPVWLNPLFSGDYPLAYESPVTKTDETGRFEVLFPSVVLAMQGDAAVRTPVKPMALRIWTPSETRKADTVLSRTWLAQATLPVLHLRVTAPTVVTWQAHVSAALASVLTSRPYAYVDRYGPQGWIHWMGNIQPAASPTDTILSYRVAVSPGKYRVHLVGTGIERDSSFEFTAMPGMRTLAVGDVTIPAASLQPGGFAPPVAAHALADGRPVSLAALRGQVVVIDFWGYWCGPCLRALPRLQALQAKYRRAHQPVTVIALHDATVRTADEYAALTAPALLRGPKITDLGFPVWLDDPLPNDTVSSPEERAHGQGQTSARYTSVILGFPTTIVLDRSGHYVGKGNPFAEDSSGVEALINAALARTPSDSAGVTPHS